MSCLLIKAAFGLETRDNISNNQPDSVCRKSWETDLKIQKNMKYVQGCDISTTPKLRHKVRFSESTKLSYLTKWDIGSVNNGDENELNFGSGAIVFLGYQSDVRKNSLTQRILILRTT